MNLYKNWSLWVVSPAAGATPNAKMMQNPSSGGPRMAGAAGGGGSGRVSKLALHSTPPTGGGADADINGNSTTRVFHFKK